MPGFEPMPEDFEPTRATLHQYANAIGVVPRVHAEPHEKWWHISLNVTSRGFETDEMATPEAGRFSLRMDLATHEIVLTVDGVDCDRFDMTVGMTGTEMGDAVIEAIAGIGLTGEYPRDKFESADARLYDKRAAAAFHGIANAMHGVLSKHRDAVGEPVSPVQLWPHGFDMAFEWFGTRVEEFEEEGRLQQLPAQCNFGFYPGGRAYLYANPWPFAEDVLLDVELPAGAEWHTEGWQGSILHYDRLAGEDDAEQRILGYFGAVFANAAPTLTA